MLSCGLVSLGALRFYSNRFSQTIKLLPCKHIAFSAIVVDFAEIISTNKTA